MDMYMDMWESSMNLPYLKFAFGYSFIHYRLEMDSKKQK